MRLALEYRPMQSIGLDFFQGHRHHYLILMDHFSGLSTFKKMKKTTAEEVIAQLMNWFFLFRVSRLIRSDNGPPFSSKAFNDF